MSTVSEDQIATRRRALGRRLVNRASAFAVDLKAIQESPDIRFLTEKEQQVLDKQLEVLAKMVKNFNILGDRLDK